MVLFYHLTWCPVLLGPLHFARAKGWIELDQPALLFIHLPQLELILKAAAERRGIWPIDRLPLSFTCTSMKHPDNDTIDKGSYIEKFTEIIEEKFAFLVFRTGYLPLECILGQYHERYLSCK